MNQPNGFKDLADLVGKASNIMSMFPRNAGTMNDVAGLLEQVKNSPELQEAVMSLMTKKVEEPEAEEGYITLVANADKEEYNIAYKGPSRKAAQDLALAEVTADATNFVKVFKYNGSVIEDSYRVTAPKAQLLLLSQYSANNERQDATVVKDVSELVRSLNGFAGPVFSLSGDLRLPSELKVQLVKKEDISHLGAYFTIEVLN